MEKHRPKIHHPRKLLSAGATLLLGATSITCGCEPPLYGIVVTCPAADGGVDGVTPNPSDGGSHQDDASDTGGCQKS